MRFLDALTHTDGRVNMKNAGYIAAALGACYFAFAQNGTESGGGGNAPTTSSELSFGPVNFAGYDNYVYRDETTAVQVLLSE